MHSIDAENKSEICSSVRGGAQYHSHRDRHWLLFHIYPVGSYTTDFQENAFTFFCSVELLLEMLCTDIIQLLLSMSFQSDVQTVYT